MEPARLKFILRATYDLLPTPVNKHRWDNSCSSSCACCRSRGTLEHILAGCPHSLGMYTWRHNQVLKVLVKVPEACCTEANRSQEAHDNTRVFV